MKSRNHHDMRNDCDRNKQLDELVRELHEIPFHPKPELGSPPAAQPTSSSSRNETAAALIGDRAHAIAKPQDLDHPMYAWDTMAREPDSSNKDGWRRAQRHCTVRVFSNDLVLRSYQPEDEKSFLTDVKAAFPEDSPQLGVPSSRGVRLHYRDEALRFDRAWTWGSADSIGVVGMAATLPVVGHPEVYSVSDIAADVVRLLEVAAARLRSGHAEIWLELAAPTLPFLWRGAEATRLSRLATFSPDSRPGSSSEVLVGKTLDSGTMLRGETRPVAVQMLQIALTDAHGVRVERAQLAKLVASRLAGS
jgi:hypothetical protein